MHLQLSAIDGPQWRWPEAPLLPGDLGTCGGTRTGPPAAGGTLVTTQPFALCSVFYGILLPILKIELIHYLPILSLPATLSTA